MPRTTISKPAHPRAYPLLWGGTASANLADGISLAAAPLLAAALTRDPALVSGLVVRSGCRGSCSRCSRA